MRAELTGTSRVCRGDMVGCQILQLIVFSGYSAQQDQEKRSNCCYLCESRTVLRK